MKKMNLPTTILFAVCLLKSIAFAGNKEIVEKRVRELDELNKQVVSSMPDIPKEGQIRIKARVRPYDHKFQFDILEKEIISKTQGDEGENADE